MKKKRVALIIHAQHSLASLKDACDPVALLPALNKYLSEGWTIEHTQVLQDHDNAATNSRDGALFVVLQEDF